MGYALAIGIVRCQNGDVTKAQVPGILGRKFVALVFQADQVERAAAQVADLHTGAGDVDMHHTLFHQILAHRDADTRGIFADHYRHLVDADQLACGVDGGGGVAAGIFDDDVEWLAEHTTVGVDLVFSQLHGAAHVFANGGVGARQGEHSAHLHSLSG